MVWAGELDILRHYLNTFILAHWMRLTISRCAPLYDYFFPGKLLIIAQPHPPPPPTHVTYNLNGPLQICRD